MINPILALCPRYDSAGKHDATGAFQPEARAFADLHEGTVVEINNHLTGSALRSTVVAAISEHKPESLALFCHGWSTGFQFGFSIQHIPSLYEALGGRCVRIALYACSTGHSNQPGGDGAFADRLRDQTGAQVDAHTTAGHCARNPWVNRFDPGNPGCGGNYIVEPRTYLWNRWRVALQGDLRFRFPFLTRKEIEAEIAVP